jgi:hypothetical protein
VVPHIVVTGFMQVVELLSNMLLAVSQDMYGHKCFSFMGVTEHLRFEVLRWVPCSLLQGKYLAISHFRKALTKDQLP